MPNILLVEIVTPPPPTFGELIDMAQPGPVRVQRQGRDVAMVLSREEFHRLSRLR